MREFLQHFSFGKGLWRFSVDGLKELETEFRKDFNLEIPPDREVYFGPSMYKSTGLDKTDVLGGIVLWADIDDTDVMPKPLFPPTFVVRSGHGWHLYWVLTEPVMSVELLEYLNKVVVTDLGDAADNCWNANRVLRVPGTLNLKNPDEPVRVELRLKDLMVKYHPQDVQALGRLDPQNVDRIKTGSAKGFRSRSERDWAVVSDMVACGVSYEAAKLVFLKNVIGDKLGDNGEKYFKHTFDQATEKAANGGGPQSKQVNKPAGARKKVDALEIVQREDGFYKGDRRLSSFLFKPKLLLDATNFEAEDALVGTVEASGFTWEDVTFSRRAFTHMAQLDRECPVAAWQWMGYEPDLRALLPYLMDKLREVGLPRVQATPTMGLHFLKGEPYFVGNKMTLSPNETWDSYKGPLAWLPSKKEHPGMNLSVLEPTTETRDFLRNVLPAYNTPGVLWTALGWFAASVVKPWLETIHRRFPVLSVTGTRGSGKSTLLQHVFMPLFGQPEPKSFDSGTTRFVTLALLGVTNAIPVSFSEFRQENPTDFLRYVRLAYDTGHDPRGKPDQTTVDYPLSAPFTVDGEDKFTDPACLERIVVAHMKPATTAEGERAHRIFTSTRDNVPRDYAGYFIQQTLKRIVDGRLMKILNDAASDVYQAFPMQLPDRVRNNHIVAHFGTRLWCDVLEMDVPDAKYLESSISNVTNLGTGKSRTMGDTFVEAIVDEVSRTKSTMFKWALGDEGHILYVQMTSSHNWWSTIRRRQGRGILEHDSIRNQIMEAPYYSGMQQRDGALMYGVDLRKASEQGLDVVTQINVATLEINL